MITTGTLERIRKLVESYPVVAFVKGTREEPQCGFSAKLVSILDLVLPDYAVFDVLADEEVRQGIKEYGSWPTIPQLWVRGELLGGSDLVAEMLASGELHTKLGLPVPNASRRPTIRLSERAQIAIDDIRRRLGVPEGYEVRLTIDARENRRLDFAPPEAADVVVDVDGVVFRMDVATAIRADGLAIDLVDTLRGREFHLTLRAT